MDISKNSDLLNEMIIFTKMNSYFFRINENLFSSFTK